MASLASDFLPTVLPIDPHSHAGNSPVRVRHLALALTVDFDQRTLAGTATWHLTNPGAAAELVLDTRDLTVETVEAIDAAGQATPTDFTLGSPDAILGQALRVVLTPATAAVRIRYRTAPQAAALQWLKPEQTAGTEPFLFTQSQAILARTWLPCQDSPGIRFTYEAMVRVPAHLLALMSAENPQERSPTGEYRFRMAQPIPAYLMALAVGDLAFAPLSGRTGIYAEPATLPVATHEFADLENMVAAAEQLYGPYRWERYDLLVLPPSFPFGGMENPRLTFVTPTILAGDRSLTSLVAHELAHSWSGNLVTNATWNDFWLNEGFTVYFERRIMEHLYGPEYADMLQVLGRAALHHTIEEIGAASRDTHLHLALAGRDPDEGLTEIAYEKGCALLLTLESLVGRPRLDAFIKEYFARFSFQAMDTATFLHYLRAELLDQEPGLEARLNLAAWVDGPGLPPNAPTPTSERFAKVDQVLARLEAGTAPADLLPPTTGWSSHEWVHFLHRLSPTLAAEQLAALDATFHFTTSGNAEILAAWFPHTLRAGYAPAGEAVKKFLLHVGRRKFVVPLYQALLATPDGLARAHAIYAEARPNYHSVTTGTLDALLANRAERH
ncbi:M1 family metallopeptidase [Microvirga sp. STS02]|uniref:M1 family metallopeptidase n=1 Tax=Hymenobacter negativus TaxID=2795026 RepID=UPI0018DDC586|nr:MULTISPECIES: M1 family metallopeptidase [Bacteria]MBH8569587.1 M1 family metallopeptidase [Hymenobacter negativus]MBR7209323.1 M1 family metallopeptidase [Microvirga sp. STS02]